MEKVFGPDGYFSNKSSTEIWNDSQAIIAEGDKTFQKYLQKLIRKARGVTDKSTDEFHNQVSVSNSVHVRLVLSRGYSKT